MRALQLDAAALSEVRRQRARAIFGKTEGRIASVDREGNTVRTKSEADYRQANGLSVAQNSMTASAYLIRGAPESCVEQATKSSFEKVCASLDSAMKLSLAQPESEFDRVNSACGPASPTCERDSVGLNSGVTSVLYACIRDALRSVVDVERAVVSDASATPPGRSVGTSENGPGQHVPGFPRRGDASSPFGTTAGGYRGGCEVDRTDARHRFCDALPPVVHYGVVCDECETIVRGRRFKCMTCTDYDLCNSCKLMGHHSYHNFRRIASPVPVVMVPNVHVVCRSCGDGTTVDGRHQSCECLLSSRRGYSHQSCCMSGHTAVATVHAASAEQAPADPAERGEVERPAVHENVWCDVCDRTIIGARFKCGNCDDFDLCSDCEAKTDHDSDHVFLKIRRPVAIKGVRIVYSPTGAPDIYQEVQQALTVSTDISANACPAFVEGPTEPTSASIHDHKGSETVAVQKCDRIVATDQPNTAAAETPMPPDVTIVQGDDTRVATLRTADPAASFAHSNVSDDFGPKVVDGCSVHANVENGAVVLSGAGARCGVVSSAPTRSEEIEDEFVMVSPADDLPERAVAEIPRAEPPNCEVDERAHCSLPTAVPSPFSLEAADASTAEDRPLCPACSWSAVASAASPTCANPAAAAADNRNQDGDVEQVRGDDVGQPNHADHGGSDVDEHRDIIGKMEEHLLILKEMGFRNRAFAELLLQQHKGDTIKSCPCCVLETDC